MAGNVIAAWWVPRSRALPFAHWHLFAVHAQSTPSILRLKLASMFVAQSLSIFVHSILCDSPSVDTVVKDAKT